MYWIKTGIGSWLTLRLVSWFLGELGGLAREKDLLGSLQCPLIQQYRSCFFVYFVRSP